MKSLNKLAALMAMVSIFVCFLSLKPASATTILKISEHDLYTRAAMIVVARCISIETRQINEGKTPFTFINFTVEEVLKGDIAVGEQLTLRHFGRHDAPGIEGVAKFKEGEEMVLFLGPKNPTTGRPFIIGAFQGKYPIIMDENTGKRLAVKPGLDGTAKIEGLQNTVDLDFIRERVRYYNQQETSPK